MNASHASLRRPGRGRFVAVTSLGGLLASGAAWVACGSSNPAGGDGGAADEAGVITLPDGGQVLPDGYVVPPEEAGTVGDAGPIPTPDGSVPIDPGASVLQHHNHANRDGVYLAPALTKAAAKTVHLDTSFDAPIDGPVYAQPLFVEKGAKGKDVLLVATERNVVYALDAADGSVVWKTPPLAAPAPLASMNQDPGCGNIDPLGITGTPIVDRATRTMFLDAFTSDKKHMLHALSIDDGGERAGWPIDVAAKVGPLVKEGFEAKSHNQRGALAIQDGVLYVPYGGHWGDCGTYRGTVLAVTIQNPASIAVWRAGAKGGAVWNPNGVIVDGASLFIHTGNTEGAQTYSQGEAVLRLTKRTTPTFSIGAADLWHPANWKDMDTNDDDIAGVAIFDVAGATPSRLALALGKDKAVYLLDRDNLGGEDGQLQRLVATTDMMSGAPVAYTTPKGTYVVAHTPFGTGASCSNGAKGNLAAFRISPGSPPTVANAWCSPKDGLGSPIATTTDGTSDWIVWVQSPTGLFAIDADTGASLLEIEPMKDVQYFQSPIVAKGRLFVAGAHALYAFKP